MAHEASLREAFDDFIEDKLYQGARPATIHVYRSNVEHFLRDTGLTSTVFRTGRSGGDD